MSPVIMGLVSHLLLAGGHRWPDLSIFPPPESLPLRVGKDELIALKIVTVTATISGVDVEQALGG